MRQKHQPIPTNDCIKAPLFQIELLGIHDTCHESGEPLKLRSFCGHSEHLSREIGCQNTSSWTNFSCRQQTLIPSSSSKIENMIPGFEPCSEKHLFSGPLHDLLPRPSFLFPGLHYFRRMPDAHLWWLFMTLL